jgi:hypothetical protein
MKTDRPIRSRGGATVALVILLYILAVTPAAAQTGAVGNGNWSSAATWTNGVPGPTDNAYIGSTTPAGAAATATVTLSQNSAASSVYLGNGAGTSGTLDLQGFGLSASSLYLGAGGFGSIARTGGGTMSVSFLQQRGGTVALLPGDSVTWLSMGNGSAATTSATGNIVTRVEMQPGATLTLGADLQLLPQPPSFTLPA